MCELKQVTFFPLSQFLGFLSWKCEQYGDWSCFRSTCWPTMPPVFPQKMLFYRSQVGMSWCYSSLYALGFSPSLTLLGYQEPPSACSQVACLLPVGFLPQHRNCGNLFALRWLWTSGCCPAVGTLAPVPNCNILFYFLPFLWLKILDILKLVPQELCYLYVNRHNSVYSLIHPVARKVVSFVLDHPEILRFISVAEENGLVCMHMKTQMRGITFNPTLLDSCMTSNTL